MCLKKYLADDLIQVSILLSLCGVRVDVDPYLLPLREIIQGQSSGLTQTHFHDLRNSLGRQGLQPKSVDVDGFFMMRQFQGWVRSLDRLQVPAMQLETWLVHSEHGPLASAAGQTGPLSGAAGQEGSGDSSGLSIRMGEGVEDMMDDGLGAVSALHVDQEDEDELIKEGAHADQRAEQDTFDYVTNQQSGETLISPLDGTNNEWEQNGVERWSDDTPFMRHVIQVFGEDVCELPIADRVETELSLQDYLRLEGDPELPDPELMESDADHLLAHQSLLSPLIPLEDPSLDLEQNWQDILAIMEPQEMEDEAYHYSAHSEEGMTLSGPTDFVNEALSLHQATFSSFSQEAGSTSDRSSTLEVTPPHSAEHLSSFYNSSQDLDGDPFEIADLFPLPGGEDHALSNNSPFHSSSYTFLDEPALASSLEPLLREVILREISLEDLAVQEGISQFQISQLEEHLDSDSGLSLNFSHSPASSSQSCCSCSSACSHCSSTASSSSDTAYQSGSEEVMGFGEGAVGGSMSSKMCREMSLEPGYYQQFPWLEHIGHDHTYNQPLSSSLSQKKPQKSFSKELLRTEDQAKCTTRDEYRAHAMRIPFSNEHIISLPVEEFNDLLSRHQLSDAQLTLVRDIRRRGKNKMAAQNCRQRKLDTLSGLEQSVADLRLRRARLIKEKAAFLHSVREMKQCLSRLCQEVFPGPINDQARSYGTDDYALPLTSEHHAMLSSHLMTNSESKSKPCRKQKLKKK
ncbi:endoplasmic reticulum membrane sensor NFE2L1a [Denticeps clupeoides]|uniref:Endoplasmic reticulum membrane sensor NFE2L1 n=1 Tax=Denticeps clupeoides TaxID=299321 RepID=A0AAY4CXR2_9TELE|nr:endoplasmic reticulum membrane sensor NFE2L1-like [Denticeps clupeoides]XP_028840954.1 endoplasmic reticulum membrane sensor NFE2L1-like [Denticeps clupeoides]XP_028840955.1 endoplasmic reticulum membrane sensor NFE2L1-like [Denticeps clupeoides]